MDEHSREPGDVGRVLPGALSALLEQLVADAGGEPSWGTALRPGAVIGRFELVRELGRGGFGVVWEARDRELGRSVAFKALRAGRSGARDERLLREAEAAARLSHPNIVTLHDVGRTEHGPYLVLELLRGGTLAQRLARGPLSVAETLRVALETARGLAHAHAQGVVHRDLTPGNVFLCDDGQVKVLDLGMAHAFGRRKLEGGTPAYMAPEQRRGAPEDERTDVFALGVVLFEMLAGEPPGGPGRAGSKGRAPRLEIPALPALPALLERMLEEDPVRRPRDALAVLEALRDLDRELARAAVQPVSRRIGRPRRRLALAALAVALLALAVAAAWRAVERRVGGSASSATTARAAQASIAVLPFADLSPQRDQEYFSDGLADEVITALAQVEGLHVVGRTSSFTFKSRGEDLRTIGRKLGVRAVLDGSVRKAGNRLRVSAQVVDVHSGFHLWAREFDRDLGDVFAVQEEIARAVVTALEVKLLPGHEPTARPYRTRSTQAHDEYLLGRQFFSRHTPEGYRRAGEAFERAIRLDPEYAPAHAWLGVVQRDQAQFSASVAESQATYRRGLEAAERAIALAPDLADGYSARALFRFTFVRDWRGAQADAERAVSLNPSDGPSHRRLGLALASQGRLDDALRELRTATEVDPLDSTDWSWLGTLLDASRRHDLAEQAIRRALEISPENEDARTNLAMSLLHQGRFAEARAIITSSKKPADRLFVNAIAARGLGEERASREALDALVAEESVNNPDLIADAYAWMGDRDRAFEWLERALEVELWQLKIDPFLRTLHADPRWPALLRKMNLPAD